MPKQPQTPTPIKTLYALLVGINDYKKPEISDLNGCVNDVQKMVDYLNGAVSDDFKLVLKKLTDSEATKQAIAESFANHFAQATENDVALFYFSGHGAQEKIPQIPVFQQGSHDKRLETLVCHDSYSNGLNPPGLADKELRYLIKQATKTGVHMVTIFDCCHSGSNTREFDNNRHKPTKRSIEEKEMARLTSGLPPRSWQHFTFHDTISFETAQKADTISQLLPEGTHIQMAACDAHESAFEIRGGGVFTRTLLDILKKSDGNISYHNLYRRVRYLIKQRFDQTPQLDVVQDMPTRAQQKFLGGVLKNQAVSLNVVFNQKLRKWILDAGALHGLSPQDTEQNEITILNSDTKQELTKARIVSIQPDFSHLEVADIFALNRKKTYTAQVKGLFLASLNVYCAGNQEGVAVAEQVLKQLKADGQADNIDVVDDICIADYVLYAQNNMYSFTRPIDDFSYHTKPIVRQIRQYTEASAHIAADYLRNMARWHFVKDLENLQTNIFPNPPIKWTFYYENSMGEEIEVSPTNEEIVLEYAEIPASNALEVPNGSMRAKITNVGSKDYYCAVVFLGQTFEVIPQILQGNVVRLAPNQTIWFVGGQIVPLDQPNYIQFFEIPQTTFYFKLLVSTAHFNVDQLYQQALPKPLPRRSLDTANKKGPNFGQITRPQTDDWTAQLIKVKMHNPYVSRSLITENIIS